MCYLDTNDQPENRRHEAVEEQVHENAGHASGALESGGAGHLVDNGHRAAERGRGKGRSKQQCVLFFSFRPLDNLEFNLLFKMG